MFNPAQAPPDIVVPDDMHIDHPDPEIPEKIKQFFGKTGKWWGTWTSPQVKGGYNAVLVIKRIINPEKADIAYLTSDFPQWYIEKSLWETTAKFLKKETGRISLLIPYDPWHTHIECWFESKAFVGVIYNRFMLSRITWKPFI
ncbi:MAG: hypothetical protein NT010_05290 [Proteobacteria bacterium]|nr:hypothetical protein [Pseudomonadota bacterium]